MEQFAKIFRKQYPEIPEDHSGWLAKIRPGGSVLPGANALPTLVGTTPSGQKQMGETDFM